MDMVWEDKVANHAKVLAMIDRARPQPGSLVVLPEMFATGFSMDVPAVQDSDSLETQKFLSQLAAEYRINLVSGVVTMGTDGRGLNQSVVYHPSGREAARYSKLHPFTLAGESDHYAKGQSVCVLQCEEFKLATFICYDLRFPEIFRVAVKRGANLYTVIANWPVAREDHWVTLLRARAIENQAYVIGVNRCGADPKLVYPGRSLIVDPHGKIMVDAGRDEAVMTAELMLEEVEAYRKTFPILNDLRSDFLPSSDLD